mmetsp:Transcript_73806/g.130136  ORF Transcript_73806/g.130136 Transcript_73806/m.130136 type:complete len:247 (-) Transcript_73806:883-1623(-)
MVVVDMSLPIPWVRHHNLIWLVPYTTNLGLGLGISLDMGSFVSEIVCHSPVQAGFNGLCVALVLNGRRGDLLLLLVSFGLLGPTARAGHKPWGSSHLLDDRTNPWAPNFGQVGPPMAGRYQACAPWAWNQWVRERLRGIRRVRGRGRRSLWCLQEGLPLIAEVVDDHFWVLNGFSDIRQPIRRAPGFKDRNSVSHCDRAPAAVLSERPGGTAAAAVFPGGDQLAGAALPRGRNGRVGLIESVQVDR